MGETIIFAYGINIQQFPGIDQRTSSEWILVNLDRLV